METPEAVPTTPEVPAAAVVAKKEKFYRNPKVIAGFVGGVIATGAAFVIAGLRGNDSDPDTTLVENDEVVETFKETDNNLN